MCFLVLLLARFDVYIARNIVYTSASSLCVRLFHLTSPLNSPIFFQHSPHHKQSVYHPQAHCVTHAIRVNLYFCIYIYIRICIFIWSQFEYLIVAQS